MAFTKRRSAAERFWAKVKKSSGCWNWAGGKSGGNDGKSYGSFATGGRLNHQNWYAHRYSYFIHFGEIPEGLFVLHKCDNGLCVNPKHLELGTHLKNMRDAVDRKRLRPYDRRGEKNSNAKLTAKDVEKIRWLLTEGYTQQSIADHYGVWQTVISEIKLGKTWTKLR